MKKTNTLFKGFSLLVIAILLVASIIITSSQGLNVHAESAHVNHNHNEEFVVESNVEVGEFDGMVVAEKNGDVNDLTKCFAPKCGCTVYKCSKCYKEETGDDGKVTYKTVCPGWDTADNATYTCPLDITSQGWYTSMMQIVGIVDNLLTPILIIFGTAGTIFVIVLGVNFSKAESADKREEAKKRMINAIIGVVVTLLLLILVKLFTANAEEIVQWINRTGNA